MNKHENHYIEQIYHLNTLVWSRLFPKFPQDCSQQACFLHHCGLCHHRGSLTSSPLCSIFITCYRSCIDLFLQASYLPLSTGILVLRVGLSWSAISYIINLTANVFSSNFVKLKLILPPTHPAFLENLSKWHILFSSAPLPAWQVLEKCSDQHWPPFYQLLSDHCRFLNSEAMLTNANLLPLSLWWPVKCCCRKLRNHRNVLHHGLMEPTGILGPCGSRSLRVLMLLLQNTCPFSFWPDGVSRWHNFLIYSEAFCNSPLSSETKIFTFTFLLFLQSQRRMNTYFLSPTMLLMITINCLLFFPERILKTIKVLFAITPQCKNSPKFFS